MLVFVFVVIVGVGAVHRAAARRQKEVADTRKMAAEGQLKIDEANKKGDFHGAMKAGDDVVGQIKNHFEKSAVTDKTNPGTARAMANLSGRMQNLMREFAAAAERLQKANVLSGNMRDRAEIEADRQIVRDFLAANAKLLDAGEHREDIMRAELDAEHVTISSRESVIAGFRQSQAESGVYELGLQIRHCGQRVGENCLALLDLLDQNWGKWRRDDAANVLRFEDNDTREAYNKLVDNVQAAFQEQRKVQEQVTAKSKAVLAK